MRFVADLDPVERPSALARGGGNSLTIAWVYHSLNERCASYRYALEHLTVAEPAPVAAEAEQILMGLQQQIAAHPVITAAPTFAAARAKIVSNLLLHWADAALRVCKRA